MGGQIAWDVASPEEQKSRTEAGAEAFTYLSSDKRDALMHLGRENCHLGAIGGNKAWDAATPEQREKRIQAGTTAFANMTSEQQKVIFENGIRGFREDMETRTEAQVESMREK